MRKIPLILLPLIAASSYAEIVDPQFYVNADKARLAEMEKAAERMPGDYQRRMKLAREYAAAGFAGEAEASWRKALEISPGTLEPYHALALFHLSKARYDDAVRVSSAWLGKDSKSYYGHFCLADALSLRGDVKKSIGVLSELRKLYPSDTAVLRALKLRYDHLGMTAESSSVSAAIADIQNK